MNKGAINISIATAIGGTVMVVGWVATYYGNLSITNEKVYSLKTEIEVIKNESKNLNEKIDRIDENVQKIGDRFGVQYLEKESSNSDNTIMTKKQ